MLMLMLILLLFYLLMQTHEMLSIAILFHLVYIVLCDHVYEYQNIGTTSLITPNNLYSQDAIAIIVLDDLILFLGRCVVDGVGVSTSRQRLQPVVKVVYVWIPEWQWSVDM